MTEDEKRELDTLIAPLLKFRREQARLDQEKNRNGDDHNPGKRNVDDNNLGG